MSQTKTIVRNIIKYGVVFVDDVVAHFTKQGYTFDQTLLVERVRKINMNPQAYGLPEGFGIGSQPMMVDGKVRRIYAMVDLKKFKPTDARHPKVVKSMKKYKTVA
jgi:hypothetical protein